MSDTSAADAIIVMATHCPYPINVDLSLTKKC